MGIAISKTGCDIIAQAKRRLLRLVAAKSAEEMQNHIEFLSAWR